jgi:hypothetical protein
MLTLASAVLVNWKSLCTKDFLAVKVSCRRFRCTWSTRHFTFEPTWSSDRNVPCCLVDAWLMVDAWYWLVDGGSAILDILVDELHHLC